MQKEIVVGEMSLIKSLSIDGVPKVLGSPENLVFNLIDMPKCELVALEEAISSEGFNFSMKDCNGKTLLQKTVMRGDAEILKLVLKHSACVVSLDDLWSVNDNPNKEILDILIKNTTQKLIKKFLLAAVKRWMEPDKLWALVQLESAIVQKQGSRKWSFFNHISSKQNQQQVLLKAIRCKSLHGAWIEEIIKSDFIKIAPPVGPMYSTDHLEESALGAALLLDDFDTAGKLLNAGYKINIPGEPSEILICIQLGVGVKGIEFLLKSGCSPFHHADINGRPKAILCENDVINEHATPSDKRNHNIIMNYDYALLVALRNKHHEMVDLLLGAGMSLSRLMVHVSRKDRYAALVSSEDHSLVENALLKKHNIQNNAAGNRVAKLAL